MTLWLVHKYGSKWMDQHHRSTHYRAPDGEWEHRIDLDANPSPAVMSDGICGGAPHRVWLEDDGEPMAARVIYDQKYPGTPAEDITDRQSPTVRVGSSGGHFTVDDDGREPPPLPGDKPPYRVPLMADLEVLPADAPVAASTFSGGGGSCLGYRYAGFRVAWANEFVDAARDTYRANFPTTILDGRDIRQVTAEQILDELHLERGGLDLLDGSPPCQSFSTAGKRQKGWGKVAKHGDGSEQRSDNLFPEFIRLVEGLQPRSFVAENVSGLVKGVAKGYFKEILAGLRAAGYRVDAALVDAQWCGVPQQRVRLIFQGMREDLGIDPVFPTPLPYRYSVREALWDLTPGIVAHKAMASGHVEEWRDPDGPSATITTNPGRRTTHSGELLVNEEPVVTDDAARAAHPDEPSPTVLAQCRGWSDIAVEDDDLFERVEVAGRNPNGGYALTPTRRRLSIAELRRICSFPDDFELVGTYAEQWARLGNAVPPLMMARVAQEIHAALGRVRHP